LLAFAISDSLFPFHSVRGGRMDWACEVVIAKNKMETRMLLNLFWANIRVCFTRILIIVNLILVKVFKNPIIASHKYQLLQVDHPYRSHPLNYN
jgi:hypothetical protein